MSALNIIKAVMSGDHETAVAECEMELESRKQELIQNGTDYILQSLSDDMSTGSDQ